MIDQQIDVRAWRDRGEAFQEFVRGEDQVARAVVPGVAERADDAAVGESRETLLRERWAQQVAGEALEPNTIVGADGAIGVEKCSPCPVWTGMTSAPTLARDAGAATGRRGARRAA